MRNNRTDSGVYNRPAQIQIPAPFISDGMGGNSAANQWLTVRSPMIHLSAYGRNMSYNARSLGRTYQFGQLFPSATHWAEFRYANDVAVDATMTLLVDNRRYQILGALDLDLEHISTLVALVEYQAGGSR